MLSQIWSYISRGGVSSSNPEEGPLTVLYNQMSFLSALALSVVSVSSLLLDFPVVYSIMTFGVSFFYIIIILLNHLNLIYAGRLFLSITAPIWVSFMHLLVAGNFSQGLLIITTLTITYVSFHRKPELKFSLMIFGIVIYLCSLVIGQYYGPYLGVIDVPYDEVFAFFITGGWLGGVIFTFVRDREKLIEDLQFNNTKLKQTTEELESFTYIASHDLKSPLRTINSFIGLIERDIRKEKYDTLPEKMQFVKSGAQQMNTLVQDILEISTLNNPDEKKKKKVDLNEVLTKVQANLTEDINSKNAIVNADILPSYYCDEAEFLLLFQNMIQNGIKYNESKIPTIDISSQKIGNQLLISFKDNGIGIDDEYHYQIFQFFKRLHTSEKYQGTGLGLGLCKKIVNSYGGDIEVDSVTGEGSTFRIKLEIETQNN